MENISWIDLYIKDMGASQISDEKKLKELRKELKSFYITWIKPGYEKVDKNKFKYSCDINKVTCRTLFNDLMIYYKVTNKEDYKNIIGIKK